MSDYFGNNQGTRDTDVSVECEACGRENSGVPGKYEGETGACYPNPGQSCEFCDAWLDDGSQQDPNYDPEIGEIVDPEDKED